MPNTIISYWDDTYKFQDKSKVLDIIETFDKDQSSKSIILDHTIMYPQGGGQPYDIGKIVSGENIFIVTEVRFKDGLIYHIGGFENEQFNKESNVEVFIDEQRRRLHAKLHTAGHLVDDAILSLNYKLHPQKGYHYPDGPYVEYLGEIEGNLDIIAKEIELKINEIIDTDYSPHAEILNDLKLLEGKVLYMPDYIPEGKPIRIVYASSPTKGQPCGGTHVKHLKEIGKVLIPKIKIKGGNTRISYLIS